ncbi:MAG: hypothetical protein ACR2MT_15740, partial [Aurantibacter sp.]
MTRTIISTFKNRTLLLFCSLFIFWGCEERQKESFSVIVDTPEGILQSGPVSLNIDFLKGQNTDGLQLFQNETPIPCQLEDNELWFLQNPEGGTDYRIEKSENIVSEESALKTLKKNGNLQLLAGNSPLVSYRYEMTYPPEGIDSIFKKSGYIHPIVT